MTIFLEKHDKRFLNELAENYSKQRFPVLRIWLFEPRNYWSDGRIRATRLPLLTEEFEK